MGASRRIEFGVPLCELEGCANGLSYGVSLDKGPETVQRLRWSAMGLKFSQMLWKEHKIWKSVTVKAPREAKGLGEILKELNY